MENLLKTKDSTDSESSRAAADLSNASIMDVDSTLPNLTIPERQTDASQTHSRGTPVEAIRAPSSLSENYPASTDGGNPFEMIGLGLEEPLPPQEAINEL